MEVVCCTLQCVGRVHNALLREGLIFRVVNLHGVRNLTDVVVPQNIACLLYTSYRPRVMSERALKTRAKIMDATRAFIVREGVGRLSIDKIVKESGTSKGAFLYHFKNRKALFCALVEE